MTSFQKMIKYIAVALAIFLIVTIFGGIITGLSSISFLHSKKEKTEVVGEMKVYPIESDISSLSIDLSGAELKIITADKFSVESNHKYISVNSDKEKLTIRETKKPLATTANDVTVILNIPENFVFDEVSIDAGAGKVSVDALSCDDLKLSLGAGKVDIKNLTANSKSEIDGGAGELNIDGGKLCNLNLDMGVGKLTLKSRLEGDSDLDIGVGKTDLCLLGDKEDYKIEFDKGVGDARIQGEAMRDDSVYGSGENLIEIDGGVGTLNIEFSDSGFSKGF